MRHRREALSRFPCPIDRRLPHPHLYRRELLIAANRRIHAPVLYDYLILLTGSFLGYREAPAWCIVITAMLLSLPRIALDSVRRQLSTVSVLTAANALLLAASTHAVGRGVAWLLGA